MPFEPIVKKRSRGNAKRVSIDKYGRLSISQAARDEIKLESHQYLVVSVDVAKKRIGIVKQDVEKVANATTFKVDKRGYVHSVGREISEKLALDLSKAPFQFDYVGRFDEGDVYWYAFELTNNER